MFGFAFLFSQTDKTAFCVECEVFRGRNISFAVLMRALPCFIVHCFRCKWISVQLWNLAVLLQEFIMQPTDSTNHFYIAGCHTATVCGWIWLLRSWFTFTDWKIQKLVFSMCISFMRICWFQKVISYFRLFFLHVFNMRNWYECGVFLRRDFAKHWRTTKYFYLKVLQHNGRPMHFWKGFCQSVPVFIFFIFIFCKCWMYWIFDCRCLLLDWSEENISRL